MIDLISVYVTFVEVLDPKRTEKKTPPNTAWRTFNLIFLRVPHQIILLNKYN